MMHRLPLKRRGGSPTNPNPDPNRNPGPNPDPDLTRRGGAARCWAGVYGRRRTSCCGTVACVDMQSYCRVPQPRRTCLRRRAACPRAAHKVDSPNATWTVAPRDVWRTRSSPTLALALALAPPLTPTQAVEGAGVCPLSRLLRCDAPLTLALILALALTLTLALTLNLTTLTRL